MDNIAFIESIREVVKESYDNSKAKGFWDGPDNDNMPTKICLMHSELSEMLEAFRNGNPDCEKVITVGDDIGSVRRITSIEEEAADLAIRLFDFCGRYEIDLGTVILAKMSYNAGRSKMHGGKKV